MLRSSVLLHSITLTWYEMCALQSSGSLVMRLTGLLESMMGVLICQQVVLLNDGWADRPVECFTGWVGCGMTVWVTPSSYFSSTASFNEWAVALQNALSFFPTVCARRRRLGIPNLAASSPVTFLICGEIITERSSGSNGTLQFLYSNFYYAAIKFSLKRVFIIWRIISILTFKR